MLLGTVTAMLALISGWLWWRLDRLQDQNTALFTEISRLRTRLRSTRQ
jgi:hypothetical protein